jgi:hypothetical protein
MVYGLTVCSHRLSPSAFTGEDASSLDVDNLQNVTVQVHRPWSKHCAKCFREHIRDLELTMAEHSREWAGRLAGTEQPVVPTWLALRAPIQQEPLVDIQGDDAAQRGTAVRTLLMPNSCHPNEPLGQPTPPGSDQRPLPGKVRDQLGAADQEVHR